MTGNASSNSLGLLPQRGQGAARQRQGSGKGAAREWHGRKHDRVRWGWDGWEAKAGGAGQFDAMG